MLPELKEMATFSGVKFAIEETYTEIERQVSRLDSIYQLLDVPPSQKTCNSIKKMIDETLAILKRPNNELKEIRDMSILFYLQNIEGLIMASCQALRIAAFKIKIPQIKGLLKENYVEAKETQALLMLLSSKYISTN